VRASEPTYLTVWPSGQGQPVASNLNPPDGRPLAAQVIARVGVDGSVAVFNAAGSTDVIVDVAGWFPTGSGYTPMSPQRLEDTRDLALDHTAPARPVPAGGEGRIQVTGRAGLPVSGVGAVVLNITTISLGGPTYLTVSPTGTPRPLASSLNPPEGTPVANLVVAKVGFGGEMSVYTAASPAHLIVDIAGWVPANDDGVVEAGTLAFGVTAALPGLRVDEGIRYRLDVAAGASFAVVAAPTPDGAGRRCGLLRLRRPDLSVAAEARTGCATPLGPELDVDATAGVGGT
jgi:hypothetical protein